jgi:hypothetical protein
MNSSSFNSSISKDNDTADSDIAKKQLHDKVVLEGRNTIERLMNTEGSDSIVSTGLIRNLRLDAITLHNFGPYGGDKIQYPLTSTFTQNIGPLSMHEWAKSQYPDFKMAKCQRSRKTLLLCFQTS